MNPLLEYFRLKYPGASLQGVLHIASLEAFYSLSPWAAAR